MQLVVCDVETSGLEDTDQVCELALVTMGVESSTKDKGKNWKDRWRVTGAWSSLVKPSCPISIPARATHHITDVELAAAPSMTGLLLKRGLPEFGVTSTGGPLVPDPIFCAHNAAFDRRMLEQSGVHPSLLPTKTICTWRCSLHLFPDSPGHSNQALRYFLGVEPEPCDLPPHRALPDALVTSAILCRMLEVESAERLVELTSTPVLLSKVHFGQHRGKYWWDLDVGMLRWVLAPQRNFDSDVRHTAKFWLDKKQVVGNS
jgi:exodeoxyribonuclease X